LPQAGRRSNRSTHTRVRKNARKFSRGAWHESDSGVTTRGVESPAEQKPAAILSPGARAMLLAALGFSVMSALVKLAGQRLPTEQIVLARGVVTLVMSIWAIRRAGISPWGQRRGMLFLRGLFGFCALFCYFYTVTHLPLADAVVLHFSNPILSAIAAALILKERFGRADVFAAIACACGVVLVARPTFLFGGAPLDPFAIGLALAGAVFSAAA
jgi:drug/metabolite transporter (DMT)-like permease